LNEPTLCRLMLPDLLSQRPLGVSQNHKNTLGKWESRGGSRDPPVSFAVSREHYVTSHEILFK
jgi:hypothetical protein